MKNLPIILIAIIISISGNFQLLFGQMKTLMNFENSSGSNPEGSLTLSGNSFYGITQYGGLYNDGVIFKINKDGSGYDTLMNFNGINGANPQGYLVLSGDSFYGITENGGTYNDGVIFKINTNGTGYKILMNFTVTIGTNLYFGPLTLSKNTLYGTTQKGGEYGKGVIFKVNTDGTGFATLMSFNSNIGCTPKGVSLIVSGNTIFGTTNYGGDNSNNYGVIFKINTDGTNYSVLQSFNKLNGYEPCAITLLGKTLFGVCFSGGVEYDNSNNGDGVIFKIDTDGTAFDTLMSFYGSNGNGPWGIYAVSGNTLYSMTVEGGSNNNGVIYKINTDGSGFEVLLNFDGSNGNGPWNALTLVGDTLYGITMSGGQFNDGVFFQYVLSAPCNTPKPFCKNVSLCEPGHATLTATGGTDYIWYSVPSGGTLIGLGSPFTTPYLTKNTTYYLANFNDTCESVRDTVTVSIIGPTLSITGLYPDYCENASAVKLTGSPAGGTFSGEGVTDNTFTPASGNIGTNIISYIYKDTLNGCEDTTTQKVTVYALPKVSFSGLKPAYAVNGTPSILTGTPAGGMYRGTGITGDEFNPALAGLGTFKIAYIVTDSNDCENAVIESTAVTLTNIADVEIAETGLMIFPNPAVNSFTLEFMNKEQTAVLVEIYNEQGILVWTDSQADFKGVYKKTIDLTGQNGIYYIKVSEGKYVFTKAVSIIR